jgi:hypothetical protein
MSLTFVTSGKNSNECLKRVKLKNRGFLDDLKRLGASELIYSDSGIKQRLLWENFDGFSESVVTEISESEHFPIKTRAEISGIKLIHPIKLGSPRRDVGR